MEPTEDQQTIIESAPGGRLWVEAGPGTGKTETLARRIAWLVDRGGLRPRELLILSFSRSAVRALVDRIRRLPGLAPSALEDLRHLSVRTFDSWAFRLLRLEGNDAQALLANAHDDNIELANAALSKSTGEILPGGESLNLSGIRHLLVDEAQDLTGIRGELVLTLLNRLAGPEDSACGFTLLGDSNQAIYGFSSSGTASAMTAPLLRGAVRQNWASQLVEHTLTHNHRATGAATLALVSKARELLAAHAEADAREPMRALLKSVAELDFVGLLKQFAAGAGTVAILCRDNHQIAGMISQLGYAAFKNDLELPPLRLEAGRPPRVVPAWIGAVLSPLTATQLTRSQFERIWTMLKREGSSLSHWELLARAAGERPDATSVDMAQLRRRLNWQDSFPDNEEASDSSITITTIHQSKGLEFDRVCLVDRDENFKPDEVDDGEEGRVLYVGLTRAKRDACTAKLGEYSRFGLTPHRDDPHRRWHHTLPSGMRQLEIGCDGDLEEQACICAERLNGENAVKAVQKLLAGQSARLIGSKVVLKNDGLPGAPGKRVYRIDLESPMEGVTTLGFMREQLTYDLLKLINHETHKLPSSIFGLRVVAVTTVTAEELACKAPPPWKQSQLWLVPVIHGLGVFKLYRRNGG